MKKNFIANKSENLSEALSKITVGISKNKILSQIKRGEIKVNNCRVNSDVELCIGDYVTAYFPASFDVNVPIIFADNNIVVVDKPIHTEVETALTEYIKEKFGSAFPLHRLDVNTAGVVAFALNEKAYNEFLLAFKEKRVNKTYIAKTFGYIDDGEYQAYLFKDAKKGKVYISNTQKLGYKHIKTGITFIEKGEISLAKINLYTGRTHQIRAHLAFLGCPIVGDDKYGNCDKNKTVGATCQKLKSISLEFYGLNSPFDYLNGKLFSSFGNLD